MRVPLLLYALALVVRLVLIAVFPDPAYPDSFYYVELARSIAAGNGLEVDFVWILAEVGGRIPADPVLPIPSNAYWLPLASLIQAPFILVLGPTAFASALPGALIGALAAPLTWQIARDMPTSSTVAIAAGVVAAVPAAGTVFMSQPENFAIFMPLTAATLWLAARGLRGDARAYGASGLLVGIAALGRNDAPLLGAAIGLMFVIDRWQAWRDQRPARIPVWAAVLCAALFFLVVTPWWIRQLAVFGSISPVASIALWLTDFGDWNSITAPSSFEAFLAQGWGPLVTSRIIGLVVAIVQFAVFIGSVVLVPLAIIAAWRWRRSTALRPWFAYFAILLVGLSLLFPLQIPNGTFIHSAVGLAPHFYVLAIEGVALLVASVASRRPTWNVGRAVVVFSFGVVLLTGASAVLYGRPVVEGWADSRGPRQALGAEIERLGVKPDDRVMSIDAGGIKYHTGLPGVVTPNDPIGTIEAVARAYDVRWIVLEQGGGVPSLAPVLVDDSRPGWIGPMTYAVRSESGEVDLALYPVCVEDADARCPGTPAP